MARLPGGRGNRTGPDRTVNQQETEYLRRKVNDSDVSRKSAVATGGTTARSLAERFAETVNVKDFGAKGDGTTDDTAAIQAAINVAAATGAEVYLPPVGFGKYYKVSKLYFYYSATFNPGFPTTYVQSRGITMRGSGPLSDTALNTPAQYHGSLLVSTDAMGPVINLDGGAAYSSRQVVLDGFSVVGTTSDCLIRFTSANTGSQLHNFSFQQNGTGGGIDWINIWSNAGMRNVLGQCGASAITTGSYGVRFRAAVSGGQIFCDNVFITRAYGVAGGFDIGIQAGALTGDTDYDEYITAVELRSIAAQTCNTGLVIGGKIRGMVISAPYFENNAVCGLNVTNVAGQVLVQGGLFANVAATTGDLVVDAATAGTATYSIVVDDCWFSHVYNYGVNLVDPTYTSGRITNCRFVRYGAGTGVAINTNGKTTPWAIEFCQFGGTGITSYDSTTKIAHRRETDGTIYTNGSQIGSAYESSSSPVLSATRTSALTTGTLAAFRSGHKTSADMADGFGSGLLLSVYDSAGAWNNLGLISASRAGADNTGRLQIFPYVAGSATARPFVMVDGRVCLGSGNDPAASAVLDLQGVLGALLVPRMSTTQRDALTAVSGMIVYNSTTKTFQVYENSAWKDVHLVAAAQADSAASDVPGIVSDFNALLAKLRTAGLLAT